MKYKIIQHYFYKKCFHYPQQSIIHSLAVRQTGLKVLHNTVTYTAAVMSPMMSPMMSPLPLTNM